LNLHQLGRDGREILGFATSHADLSAAQARFRITSFNNRQTALLPATTSAQQEFVRVGRLC
jgi:hypothetical protein